MDEAWDWRSAFKRASTLRQKQDDWCARASNFAQTHPDQAPSDDGFPEELELEALVDVLRGKVKVNTHCYTGTWSGLHLKRDLRRAHWRAHYANPPCF